MTTTSSVLLDTLEKIGITHIFVNLGSDHPALLEAFIAREGKRRYDGEEELKFITAPNESVALNCAQGFYQASGKPAAVIVHVDCGTQALAGAVHNVAAARIPVFIYAGASPFSQEGEMKGSRNEFIHWLQDAVDQPAIIRQYMKHVAEIRTGKNVQQVVLRSLQFAKSQPEGPVYCWSAREISEEDLNPSDLPELRREHWSGSQLGALSETNLHYICQTLRRAQFPIIVTSYAGRNRAIPDLLGKLANQLSIAVFSSCPSHVNIAFNHPMHAGVSYTGKNCYVEAADWILVLDCDVPWMTRFTKLRRDATVIHIDMDVLKERMNMFYIPAELRVQADSATAVQQIQREITRCGIASFASSELLVERLARHLQLRAEMRLRAPSIRSKGIDLAIFLQTLRRHLPENNLVLNESISNYPAVWDGIAPTRPGSLLTSGGSSLGWGLGAAIGAILAGQADKRHAKDLVTLIVGDGSFIFGVPSAAFWMARRYGTPFLTIVLNNGGYKSPRLSMLGVYPDGLGSSSTAESLNISFGPQPPDYGLLAEAAGGAWHTKVTESSCFETVIRDAISVVQRDRRCAVIDVQLEKF
ncbi:hypothetical protein NliqN6_6561 [Naganishia liquefaciens]|uniref:Thiamine pyrophosphate-requiring protein n=1 Tax=Naganishia liquefaciens TaxID=104408 RepID=A0A8H3YHQ8_9TREE|nr:hypothetical protein NliqN6_6561 [Naganishia liquefaciens]